MDATKHKWLAEARRYADHAYCYKGMVDEFPEQFDAMFKEDCSPYQAVDMFACDAGLDRADAYYGINSGQKFVKLWKPGNPENSE